MKIVPQLTRIEIKKLLSSVRIINGSSMSHQTFLGDSGWCVIGTVLQPIFKNKLQIIKEEASKIL